jgi:hypothetical protein
MGDREPDVEAYVASEARACPFCGGRELMATPIERADCTGWAAVLCPDCGATWQEVWSLIDIVEALPGTLNAHTRTRT